MRIAKPWKRKSNGKWYVQHGAKQIDLGPDKKKAFAAYNELLRSNAVGPAAPRYAKKDEATFHELVDDYTAWIKSNRAPSMFAIHQYFFRDLKACTDAKLAAIEFTPRIFEATYFKTNSRIKSPSTKGDRIKTAIRMFNWAVEYGYLTANPLARMKKPTQRVRQEFVPPERIQELLDHAKNQQLKDFMAFAIETGARAQEMFAAEAKHIDGSKIIFWIEDSKGRKISRVVYMTSAALEIATRLAAEHPTGPLFRNTRGVGWTKNAINCAMIPLKEKMGIPTLCATTLRHTFCHARIQAGQSPVIVAKLMGHTSSRMVETRYGHIENSRLLEQKAAEFTLLSSSPASIESTDPAPNGGTAKRGRGGRAGASTCKASNAKAAGKKRPQRS